MLIGMFFVVVFILLFIRVVAQFLIYVIIYPVNSSNRGIEFHFINFSS